MKIERVKPDWYKGTYKNLTFFGSTRKLVICRFVAHVTAHPEVVRAA